MGKRRAPRRRWSLTLGAALAFLVGLTLFSRTPGETRSREEPTAPVGPRNASFSPAAPASSHLQAPVTREVRPLWQLEGNIAPSFVPTTIARADGQTVRLNRELHTLQVGETVEVPLSARPNSPLLLTLERRSTLLDSVVLQGRFAGPVGLSAIFTDNGTVIQTTLETPAGILEGIGWGPLLWLYDPRSLEASVDPNDTLRPRTLGAHSGE